MSKIFIDANILLDILLSARKNHKKAVKAYSIVCDRYEILVSSENILTTIEYIANKNGTDCKVIWKFFNNLTQNFEIVNFSSILDEALAIYKNACNKSIKIDFEDLLQIESAIKSNCLAFLTEDKEILNSEFKIEVLSLNDLLN